MEELDIAEKKFKIALLNHIKKSFLDERFSKETKEPVKYDHLIEIPSMDKMVKWYYEYYPNRYTYNEPELKDFIVEDNKHEFYIIKVFTTTVLLAITSYMISKLFKRDK